MTPLWDATRDLHHACEQHPVGAALASGKPPLDWYAKWLTALFQIHLYVDNYIPDSVGRTDRLEADILAIDLFVAPLNAPEKYIDLIDGDPLAIAGAAYVLTGAHLMGGEVMRRRLDGYPTKHLQWDDRKEALAVLQTYRTREDISTQARDCFAALLAVMDEIKEASNG
jgi:hypothetical protein